MGFIQVGLRSITKEGREQGKRFGVEQYEMRTFSKDREKLENLVIISNLTQSQCTLFQMITFLLGFVIGQVLC
jgi:hypothetical protein